MIRYYVTDRRQGDMLASSTRRSRRRPHDSSPRERPACQGVVRSRLKIRDIAAGTNTRVLVNDRLDVALAADIDGVHLPSRWLAGRPRPAVGETSRRLHALRLQKPSKPKRRDADFIVFGPVFDSPGKSAVGLEPLKKVVSAVEIPVFAIGGITAANSDSDPSRRCGNCRNSSVSNGLKKPLDRSAPVRVSCDGPAYDDIVCACCDRFVRSRSALLVIERLFRHADSWSDDFKSGFTRSLSA